MRPCFAFSARTTTSPAVLAIDQEIGFWGMQARDFRNALNAVEGDDLVVEINSPGGDVMAGLGMYNMIRNSGKTITTRATGVAASIASVIMLAGDNREMPSNAFAMVHSVMSGAFGTADELREQADVVDKVQASIRNIYVSRMGIDEAKAIEIMAKDTWLTAEECLELGFATAVLDPIKATAKFDMHRADLPEHVAEVFATKADDEDPPTDVTDPPEPPEPEAPDTPLAESIVAEAKRVGLEAHGSFFALSCSTLDEAKAQMVQAREITALCAVAGTPDAAKQHIRAGAKVVDVRAALVAALAKTDTPIDNTPQNNAGKTDGSPAKPTDVTPTSLWASHNSQSKKGA